MRDTCCVHTACNARKPCYRSARLRACVHTMYACERPRHLAHDAISNLRVYVGCMRTSAHTQAGRTTAHPLAGLATCIEHLHLSYLHWNIQTCMQLEYLSMSTELSKHKHQDTAIPNCVHAGMHVVACMYELCDHNCACISTHTYPLLIM